MWWNVSGAQKTGRVGGTVGTCGFLSRSLFGREWAGVAVIRVSPPARRQCWQSISTPHPLFPRDYVQFWPSVLALCFLFFLARSPKTTTAAANQ